jgi:hypothetical protein
LLNQENDNDIMSYIFLDESGDLGFNPDKKSSRFFMVTFLFVEDKRPIEKAVKKTHAELSKKLKKKIGELHAVNEKPITRQRLLKRLHEKECSIMVIYLNKKKVFTKLQDEKQVLYNYITNILLDRIFTRRLVAERGEIELIASRRETNRFFNENFKDYLESQVRNNHSKDISISIRTPQEEKGLQAVDCVSWAVFRKYEGGDEGYYNLIKEKIVEESALFP